MPHTSTHPSNLTHVHKRTRTHTHTHARAHAHTHAGANWCFFNDLYQLSLPTSTWTQVDFSGALPSPRCFHTSVVVADLLVVFGGARLTRDTWEYFDHLYSFRLSAQPCAPAVAAEGQLEQGDGQEGDGKSLVAE